MSFMYSREILKELEKTLANVEKEDADLFVEMLQQANRIFCDGLGRSGLCCKGFAMRLMHLGMVSYFVGETVTPSIQKGDLLLICSGSGESAALISHGKKAKEKGAKLAAITGNRGSTLGKLADVCICIASPRKDETGAWTNSLFPMGSLFEGAASLVFENLVLMLIQVRGETSETMFARHANLE